MPVISIAGFVLLICTLASAVFSAASLIMTFGDLGGWGFSLVLWFGFTAFLGTFFINRLKNRGYPTIPMMAYSGTVCVLFLIGVCVLWKPPEFPAWWGLLTPVVLAVFTPILRLVCSFIASAIVCISIERRGKNIL